MKTFLLPFLKRLGGRFAFEPKSRRLFIPDGKDLFVIDADTGKTIGEIPKVGYVSDIAFAPDLQKAFVVDSQHDGMVIVNLQSFEVTEKVHKITESFRAIYDASTKKLFTISYQTKDCQIFDPTADAIVASVKLGGYPLQGFGDSAGHAYFEVGPEAFRDPRSFGITNIISPALQVGSTGEIEAMDGHSLQIIGRWKEPSCRNMRLVGFDMAHQRMFAGCGDSVGSINPQTGELTLSSPIPTKFLWYLQFDEGLGDLFAVVPRPPTLIVLHENSQGEFEKPVIATEGFPGDMVPDGKTASFFVLQSDEKPVNSDIYVLIPNSGQQPMKATEPVPGTYRLMIYSKH